MGKVFADHSISLDGFSTGPNVGMSNPMGDGGEELHAWQFRGGRRRQVLENLFGSGTGAVLVGRHTFDLGEKHWGDDPPFHLPVFVVTHRAKATVTKRGGTTYTFVTDGIERALAQARATADDRDVVVLGGAAIIQQCLRAGLLDELRLHLVHILLGGGTRLLGGTDPAILALERTRLMDDEGVTHLDFRVEGRIDEAILRKEGERLISETAPPRSLLALLATLEPIDEAFPPIPELPTDPVLPP